ncbi:MAG: hypothetical protein CYPHOPRED_003308 [Cyphobasidiales sp. Tagirdzhanova-0007]|nr:MAG: hypothetical protein CYPHOPRED_003308 [Cyphobasidiales sp. Tagirdzhanova-0007]
MAEMNMKKPDWTFVYPVQQLTHQTKEGRVLLIDIGGGTGRDIEKFRKKIAEVAPGSLILQETRSCLENTKVHSDIKTMEHDFFKPQPIKGAKAYFMHWVLHDWPDAEAVTILRNTAEAMERGYSKLLVYDTVIAFGDTRPDGTSVDLTMMFALGAAERTEAAWKSIITAAGLAITKIWTLPEATESVIEIELA